MMNLLDLARSALPPMTITPPTSATAEQQHQRVREPLAVVSTTRAVVAYDLIDSKGGLLIDPDGPASAVRELRWRYGDRLDWPALLAMFESRERQAERDAAALIRRIMGADDDG